jgi:hypothetical protein
MGIRVALLAFLLSLSAFAQTNPCGTAPHCGVLNWTWTQGTGGAATGFNIKRSTTTGGPYSIVGNLTGTTTTTFTDLSGTGNVLVEGTTYFWVITATCASCGTGGTAGESSPSPEVSGKVPFQAPQAPTGDSVVVR